LLPERDLPLRLLDDRAYVEWLGVQDEPWLRVLVGEMVRFEGRRRRELGERLAEPLPCDAPYLKRRAATRVLLRMWNPPARTGGGTPWTSDVTRIVGALSCVSNNTGTPTWGGGGTPLAPPAPPFG